MRTWFVTFGGSHTHPLSGESLRDCYVRVPAEEYRDVHQLMFASVFGRRWAFVYEYADAADVPRDGFDGAQLQRSAGVERFGLREVPWIPPSVMARRLLDLANGDTGGDWAILLSPDRWVDLVVNPAEVEHQRAIAEAARSILTPDARGAS